MLHFDCYPFFLILVVLLAALLLLFCLAMHTRPSRNYDRIGTKEKEKKRSWVKPSASWSKSHPRIWYAPSPSIQRISNAKLREICTEEIITQKAFHFANNSHISVFNGNFLFRQANIAASDCERLKCSPKMSDIFFYELHFKKSFGIYEFDLSWAGSKSLWSEIFLKL